MRSPGVFSKQAARLMHLDRLTSETDINDYVQQGPYAISLSQGVYAVLRPS